MGLKAKRKKRRDRVSADRRLREHKSGFESTAIKLPEGMKRFKLKEGKMRIDVIPYRVGKGNPFADKGEVHYERTFYTHPRIGPEENTYICMRKTFHKRCFVCDYREKLAARSDADEDLIKSLFPKERQMFAVVDTTERDEGVQLFEVSHHCFGKRLDEELRDAEDDDDEVKFFADPKDGKTLKLGVVEEKIGKNKFMNVNTISFVDRPETYDASIIEEVPCLDKLLIPIEYDKLRSIFLQEDEEDDDEDNGPRAAKKGKKKPAKKGKKSKDEDEDEDEDDDEEDDEDEDDDEEDDEDDDEEEDDEDEDDDEEDEKPRKKKGKPSKKKPAKKKPAKKSKDEDEDDEDDDDDDDDDEEEDDDKPAKKKGGKKKPAKKPAKKGKKKPADDDDDEDEDDDDDDDDDEDDDE